MKIGGVRVQEGTSVGEGGKAYCILGFRVPTTSVGTKGSKAYCILGFRVPTTCEYKKFDYHV